MKENKIKISTAIDEITKIRADLLFGDDWGKGNEDSIGDILFIKAIASLETSIQDLRLCKMQYSKEERKRRLEQGLGNDDE